MKHSFSAHEIHIHFLNQTSGEKLVLEYQLYSHDFNDRWLKLLPNSSFSEGVLSSLNFAGQPFDDQDLVVATLNVLLMKINLFVSSIGRPELEIPLTVEKGVSQKVLNELHNYYERYMEKMDLFMPILSSIKMLNLFIHRMESFSDGKVNDCGIVDLTAFSDKDKYYLQDEDYYLFSKDWIWGQLTLSYCLLGVPTLQAFRNKSIPIPQNLYSVGIILTFVTDSPFTEHEEFNQWARSIGLDPDDPKIAAGYLPMGMLKNIPPTEELKLAFLKRLSQFRTVEKVVQVNV